MNKYIIFIIFGILLFLLLNTTNGFSIGNQYKLDLTSSGQTNSNVVLKHMFDIIVESQNICRRDFEQCRITMHEEGDGSCQINTLVGLYNIALSVPFDDQDKNYINSQGLDLRYIPNIERTYDYLTNREIMIPLLRHNGINSNVPIHGDQEPRRKYILDFKPDHLYPIYIGIAKILHGESLFFHQDDDTTEYNFGHNSLMYKTNYAGLSSFLDYLDSQGIDRDNALYSDLLAKKTQLEDLDDYNESIKDNGIVCIIIDFCQKEFYAVTEFSNPSTLDLFDDDGDIPEENVQRYNDLWRVKIITECSIRFHNPPIIKFTDASNGEIIQGHLNDLTPDDFFKSPTDDLRQFIDSFYFFSYFHEDKNYGEDGSDPVIKDREDFLGFPNTQCKESQEEPLCRNPDYFCYRNFPVNDSQYDVCKQKGELNTPCRDSEPKCNDGLYCDDDICKKLDTSCGPHIGGGVAMIQTYLVRIYIDSDYNRIDVEDSNTTNGIINDVEDRQNDTVISGWRGIDSLVDDTVLDMDEDGDYQQFRYYQVTTYSPEKAIELANKEFLTFIQTL